MSATITYTNEELGIQSRIIPTEKGFNVVLHDTDADATFPMAKTFTELAGAESYARHIAGKPAVRGER